MYSFSGHEIAAFRGAKPFPHLVVDNYVHASVAEVAARELEALPDDAWKWKNAGDGKTLHKGSINRPIEAAKTASDLLKYLAMDEAHIDLLRELTGIEYLVGDPGGPEHFEGGGFHRIDRGGRLEMHVDFNTLKDRPVWRRRVNLLLYLNQEWKEEWGGDLQLQGESLRRSIQPIFNRAVIFLTSELSWHGHPLPLACPEGRNRLSIASYYYTQELTAPAHHTTRYA